jgi:hypothetical protein
VDEEFVNNATSREIEIRRFQQVSEIQQDLRNNATRNMLVIGCGIAEQVGKMVNEEFTLSDIRNDFRDRDNQELNNILTCLNEEGSMSKLFSNPTYLLIMYIGNRLINSMENKVLDKVNRYTKAPMPEPNMALPGEEDSSEDDQDRAFSSLKGSSDGPASIAADTRSVTSRYSLLNGHYTDPQPLPANPRPVHDDVKKESLPPLHPSSSPQDNTSRARPVPVLGKARPNLTPISSASEEQMSTMTKHIERFKPVIQTAMSIQETQEYEADLMRRQHELQADI